MPPRSRLRKSDGHLRLRLPAAAPPRLRADTLRPYVGIVGVLLGATMATLGSRVTTFGLADLRGGLHAGFDEGAWITTSFGVGQMMSGVASPYMAADFRRAPLSPARHRAVFHDKPARAVLAQPHARSSPRNFSAASARAHSFR